MKTLRQQEKTVPRPSPEKSHLEQAGDQDEPSQREPRGVVRFPPNQIREAAQGEKVWIKCQGAQWLQYVGHYSAQLPATLQGRQGPHLHQREDKPTHLLPLGSPIEEADTPSQDDSQFSNSTTVTSQSAPGDIILVPDSSRGSRKEVQEDQFSQAGHICDA